jgi:hypothetical protein
VLGCWIGKAAGFAESRRLTSVLTSGFVGIVPRPMIGSFVTIVARGSVRARLAIITELCSVRIAAKLLAGISVTVVTSGFNVIGCPRVLMVIVIVVIVVIVGVIDSPLVTVVGKFSTVTI